MPKRHHSFEFLDWNLNTNNYQLTLHYRCELLGKLTETLYLPQFIITESKKQALDKACQLIHLMCGVSYYKFGLATEIKFAGDTPSHEMALFIEKTWKHGLAELVYCNDLDGFTFDFVGVEGGNNKGVSTLLPCKRVLTPLLLPPLTTPLSLVPLGGGKDSLVTLEELKAQDKNITLFMVGSSQLIKDIAKFTQLPLLQVKRKIDQKLIDGNKTGQGFNGHVPITAINSCISVLCALLYGFNEIVFSNERSADSANTVNSTGLNVNHQYSKSHEFERDLQKLIQLEISEKLDYYSQQRAFSELAILKKFSQYPQYFPVFSSCNRNFHIDGSHNSRSLWCCDCPKCRFVFLGLAVFIEKQQLLTIFGKNLLADPKQKQGFAELLGLQGIKPFECVGEIEESQFALTLLKDKVEWRDETLVQYFVAKIPPLSINQQQKIMQPS